MTKYLVIELQTNTDGTMGSIVTSFDNRNQAENQYHTVLAAASISTKPIHSAVLMTNEGFCLEYRCYKHEITTEE